MALQWLRDKIKYLAWILYVIAAAFVLTLLFDPTAGSYGPGGQVAATVGPEQITYDEFRREYRNLEDRYRQMFGQQWNSEMAEQLNIAKQALDQLIDRRILLLEADRAGLIASDEEVRNAVVEVFTDEEGKFLGRERVQNYLRNVRMSEQEFDNRIRQDVLVIKLRSVLSDTLFIGPGAPWENAYAESFNSRLRDELLACELFTTLDEAR